MQLGVLPGGTCDDYLTHITNCLDDIAETYAAYNQLDKILVKHLFVQHIKNTLTDRVAVNHCVVQALNTDLDIELLERKCSVHPIDGIAKNFTDLLKVYDEQNNVERDCYGFWFMCCKFHINAMTKMRYKQGKGDPAGFKIFMHQENIKPSVIC